MTNREYQRMQQRAMKRLQRQKGMTKEEAAMKASFIQHRSDMEEKQRNKDIAKGTGFTLLSLLLVLHERFGFGEKRLNTVMDGYSEWIDKLQNGRIGLLQLKELCEKETGMRVEFKWYSEDDTL